MKYITEPYWELSEHKSHVIKLFKDAGLKDSTIQFVKPLDFSHVASGNAWVFDQFPNNREEVVGRTIDYFHQAIGVYRSRALEVFNPFYWIEFFIYLPKHVLNYLGFSPESVIIRIAQIIYWSAATVVSLIYALYTSEINMFVKNWINQLIS